MTRTFVMIAALVAASPVAAQTFQTVKPATSAGAANAPGAHVWLPAPTPKGAVGWDLLMQTKEVEKKIDGVWYITPAFAPSLKKYDKKRIKVNGYMLPLQTSQGQSVFVLMAYSPSCPFCMTAGSQAWMEVQAKVPIKMSQDAMLLEGDFELVPFNAEGVFYRLRNAALASQ
jgi:uncharacterized protein